MVFLDASVRAQKTTDQVVAVSSSDAKAHLTKNVVPVYPPLAKDLRLQGKVKVQVVISKTGMVESTNVVSGHPLLVQAAINAVKQWQYRPFLVDGQPVTASTEIDVPFSLGIPDATYQSEEKNSEVFFKRQDECRELLKAQKYSEAQAPCASLVELAEKLPKERQVERMTANELAGHALLYQQKFNEALNFFQSELAIGEASLKPTDAELGYAYHHVGLAYYAAGTYRRLRPITKNQSPRCGQRGSTWTASSSKISTPRTSKGYCVNISSFCDKRARPMPLLRPSNAPTLSPMKSTRLKLPECSLSFQARRQGGNRAPGRPSAGYRGAPGSARKSGAAAPGVGMTRHPRMGVICPQAPRTGSLRHRNLLNS